jgi:hypothetical protein
MHKFRGVFFLALFCAVSSLAYAQQTPVTQQAIAKIVARENDEMKTIRQYSPLVETYIQKVKPNNDNEWSPDGDRYFFGRAAFATGYAVKSLDPRGQTFLGRFASDVKGALDFDTEFLPKGFLQMIYVDEGGLDPANYNFEYVRQEFIGEVRTLVFDVVPAKKAKKGHFMGRIWAEDKNFTIVRFDGTYAGISDSTRKFHFDSWRMNVGPNLWLPAAIYSESTGISLFATKGQLYKAQTRIWGYDSGTSREEEELSQVLIESASPVKDETKTANDLSPVQEQREWNREAADNVVDKLQRIGLIAPKGDVDNVLNTVINNLEVTNNLDIEPEVNCRVLMTSTMESFAIGHTIVLSRGLIDVLPDEATLAAMLAEELGRVIVAKPVDTRFAFNDRFLERSDKQTLDDFRLAGKTPEDKEAAAKAAELLKNSPYKSQLRVPGLFMAMLHKQAALIPNLINPRLGDAVFALTAVAPDNEDKPAGTEIVALPLGGRIKIDPWGDNLTMLKSGAISGEAARDKMPFEITPFMFYLTRQEKPAA